MILFLGRLAPLYRILNSEDLPVRFRFVHCSPRLHAPLFSIPGPFRNSVWASSFPEIIALPSRPLDVALYLEHLIQGDTSSSVLHSASCGISWANKLYGFPDPCQDPLVKNILEAGVRISAKPVVKKEPITPEMISSICSKYASPSANLSSLRIAALFITAYCAFLRFDELAKLSCCDVISIIRITLRLLLPVVRLTCTGMVLQFFWLRRVLSIVPIRYSAAANAGISDRLFKRHGRGKSDRARDGYVKDNINSLLSVSRSLGL